MGKIVIILVIIGLIYFLFFKDRGLLSSNEDDTSKREKKDAKKDASDSMIECKKCNTFVAIDEAILQNGKYFCSKECVDLQ